MQTITRSKKMITLLTILALVISLTGGLSITALAASASINNGSFNNNNEYTVPVGVDTITFGAALTGKTIIVPAGRSVKFIGGGTATKHVDVTIQCGAGVTITLENIYIENNANSGSQSGSGNYIAPGNSFIRFTGSGNVLHTSGTVLLESTSYVSYAGIAVNYGTSLNFTGAAGSKFYLYKYSQGCGIGADANEANGNITFTSGTYFMKGSKTGAIIGNDTAGNAAKEAQIGTITINGANLFLVTMSQGAAIGGSRMSIAKNVNIAAGNVSIVCDFTGSAIGAGAQKNSVAANNGNVTIGTGASLQLMRTGNSTSQNYDTTPVLNDTLATAAIANGNNGTALRQCAVPVGNSSTVTIYEGNKLLYSGTNPSIYEFVNNTSSTMANWPNAAVSGVVYIYLTASNHVLLVNGTLYDAEWTGSGFSVEPQ